MLMLFPWLAWIAVGTSAALLVMLYASEELAGPRLLVPAALFLVAVYCQFLGSSGLVVVGGLVLQTVLAVCLLIRWKASAW